jgi:hypothetical protein
MLACVVILSGCSTLKYADGSSTNEIESYGESKPASGFKPVVITLTEPKPVTEIAVTEMKSLKDCPACPPCPEVAKTSIAKVAKKSIADIKIKVLNGNGNIVSAKRMEKKIVAMGYEVERVDDAPRFTFKTNTIYYADCCKDDAEELARKLGGRTITKSLTWNSIFDIIAVTGNE